jgi:hypothetical protein
MTPSEQRVFNRARIWFQKYVALKADVEKLRPLPNERPWADRHAPQRYVRIPG